MPIGDGKFQPDDVLEFLDKLLIFLKKLFPEEFIQEFLVKLFNSWLPKPKA